MRTSIQTILCALVALCGPMTFGATFVSFSSATYSVTEPGDHVTISVLRAGNPHGRVTIGYATSNLTALAGSDYVDTTGQLIFNSGQRLKKFSVPIIDDVATESNETFRVTLSVVGGSANLRNPKVATVTIIDNEGNSLPNVSVTDVTADEGNSGTTPFVFTLRLSSPSVSTVSVDYATVDGTAVGGSDYVSQNGTMIFTPGQTNKTITVLVNADTVNEPDKIFFVNLSNISTNATLAPEQGIGTIVNDDGPIVMNDAYATLENTPLVVPAPGVLSNDTDVAGNPFTAELVADPVNGTLTLNPDGSFTYTPNIDFSGIDTFSYSTYDGVADSEIATVTITVTHVNRPPAAYDDSYGTTPNTPINIAAPGILANDFDLEGDPITAALGINVANGTLNLNADGSFDYTPNNGFAGVDTFTYIANDGQSNSAPATVNLYVDPTNHVPVAVADGYATTQDTPVNVNAPGILANDTDADLNALTAILVAGPTHGTLGFNSAGSFSYTPSAGYNGYDLFRYRANDGLALSSVAAVTIAVGNVDNAPVANDDALNIFAGATANGNVLSNDTDADNDPLTAVLVTDPVNGTLNLNPDGSFDYTPDANFTGTDTFLYRANDGFADSGLATVTVNVTAVTGAGDDDLYVRSAKLTATGFKMTGKVNPRGAGAGVPTLQVYLNGTPLAGTTKTKFSNATGAFSYRVAADLSAITGTPLQVTLQINGVNLEVPVLNADLQMPVPGKFAFKKNKLLTGCFNWNKTAVAQLNDGTFKITGQGVIEAENGDPVAPTGPIHATVGGATATGATITITDTKHAFKFSILTLAGTGVPAAGAGAATSYELPITFEVPTAGGTNVFETIIELKRATGTSTKWSR